MTAHELARKLLQESDIEVGFFDGEGHWLKATGLRPCGVDEADWQPMGREKQTGQMRSVIEIYSGVR
jgi:hypothetical protein